MTGRRGSTVAEALVGLGLAAIALAGVAGVAGLATRSLRLARDMGIAVALGAERLERLRLAPGADGADTMSGADGTVFSRQWSHAGGRGRPTRLSARVTWGRHVLDLRTEVPP